MNWNLEKIYYNYLMGAYNSRYELEDWNTPRIGYSLHHRTSDWDFEDKPKNFDYWFSKERLTYISRKHYKNDYVNGYLWGRYQIKNSLDTIYETETENIQTDTSDTRNNKESQTDYSSSEYEEEERSF
jgi:hypothetical protein